MVLAMVTMGCDTGSSPSKKDKGFTVTFDKNGGDTEASPKTKTVTPPATTVETLPTAPIRAGYSFVQWNTKADGTGTEFTAATPVTKDTTVYAKWEQIFTVTFDKNGGTTEANPRTKTGGASGVGTLPTAPT
jgi:uncharacterized repeat protein (TIGR02543 family)